MPRSVLAGAKLPPYYAHLQTFARLREATSAELPALLDLGRAAGAEEFDWERALAESGRDIVLAYESDALIGAIVTERSGSLVSHVGWIGVARSARRNGVGRLLIETAAENALTSGISILRFRRHLMGYGVHQLLTACGFEMTAIGYERQLHADRG
ncbi:MAG TPA: GNAT family N-acetyltransferase [Devosia sp.]|nr:GNAT family N-acetyltransferase [Devosia sp.]